MNNQKPVYVTSIDVCTMLHISRPGLWRLRHTFPKPIQFTPHGKKLYKYDEVINWVEKHQKTSNHDPLSLV